MDATTGTYYWKSPAERERPGVLPAAEEPEFTDPQAEGLFPLGRRRFLKAAGFGLVGAVLAGCSRAPEEKAIPFLRMPEETIPGRASWYASTCGACPSGCGLLVKVRDGRPIKLEGNGEHPYSRGGLCAAGQASLLGLYDARRLRHPLRQGSRATWDEVDSEIRNRLGEIRRSGGAVRFVTGTIPSPTVVEMIEGFLGSFADARHVIYDPLSCSAILDAHERTHRVRFLPRYRFERAEVIVSVEADFLGTWISPVEFTAAYRLGRDLEADPPRSSHHVQFESRLSITGSKADLRVPIAPEEVGTVLTELARRISKKSGSVLDVDAGTCFVDEAVLDRLADRLWRSRGRSLVVCGAQDLPAQATVNLVNHLLGGYGTTLETTRPSLQRRGSDSDVGELIEEIRNGHVAALFIHGVNPVYDLPDGAELGELLRRIMLVVSFAEREDETAASARFVCPDHHFLESWCDAEGVSGVAGITQPVIRPLWETRSLVESLATWSGTPASAYEILRRSWKERIYPRRMEEIPFREFWDRSVHDGFTLLATGEVPVGPFRPVNLASSHGVEPASGEAFTLLAYPKVAMTDGRHAHNPWLHELPDPITKVVWDNYASLSPAAARRIGVSNGDLVAIEVDDAATGRVAVELPAFVQPGQHERTVAVALGYGRAGTERFADVGPEWIEGRPSVGENHRVGQNIAPLLLFKEGVRRYVRPGVKVRKVGRSVQLATTQTHHTIRSPEDLALPGTEVRPIIQETTLAAYRIDRSAGSHPHNAPEKDLWPDDHPYTGHHWGIAIDLSACTGCSACVIACQAENNIPVVGKDEVARARSMHWMRIDRYYSGEEDQVDVVHQPMMCQQCDNAPCETVCPVLATVHSEEGLNQQIYNRCIGTRYCSNNCPYKVRRFNWFDYPREDPIANLVLNPDVTVRSRGVMEKCTFCVQRIQEARIEWRMEGRSPLDGSIRTACEQSCPARAITFGDRNDPESRVSRLLASGRSYQVLAELNVRPSIGYLTLVRNRDEASREEHHG